MTGISQDDAQAMLDLWMGVLRDIASNGQAVTIGNRSYTAANLGEVQRQVAYWEGKVNRAAAGGGIRVRGIVPHG